MVTVLVQTNFCKLIFFVANAETTNQTLTVTITGTDSSTAVTSIVVPPWTASATTANVFPVGTYNFYKSLPTEWLSRNVYAAVVNATSVRVSSVAWSAGISADLAVFSIVGIKADGAPVAVPMAAPTAAPDQPPVEAPVRPPFELAVQPSESSPVVSSPVSGPEEPPAAPPAAEPEAAPERPPVAAPERPPVAPPVNPPTLPPISIPMAAPVAVPTSASCAGVAPSAGAVCSGGGVWVIQGNLSESSAGVVNIGGSTTVNGSLLLSSNSTLIIAAGATLDVTNCAQLGGILNVSAVAPTQSVANQSVSIITFGGGYCGAPSTFSGLQLNLAGEEACAKRSDTSLSYSSQSVALLFSYDRSGCSADQVSGGLSAGAIAGIVVAAVVVGAIILAIILAIKYKQVVRPFTQRFGPPKTPRGEIE